MSDYFFWSEKEEGWIDDTADWMTFVLIPRKWWSLKAWRFANDYRAHLLNSLMKLSKPKESTYK